MHLYTITATTLQPGLPPTVLHRYATLLGALTPTQTAIYVDVPPGLSYGRISGGLEITSGTAWGAPMPLDNYYPPLTDIAGVQEIAREADQTTLRYSGLQETVTYDRLLLVLPSSVQIRIYRRGATGAEPALRLLHWTGQALVDVTEAGATVGARPTSPITVYSGTW